MSDFNFEQLLAQYNQEYKDAEEFGNDWMPDDGEYVCTITDIKKDVSTKKEVPVLWWKITARIEDVANEKINGKEFTLGFYRSSAMGILKSAVKALNKGVSVAALPEASKIFEGSLGEVVRVKVVTTTKNDRTFTNAYIQEVLATTQESVEEGEPETETQA